MMTGAGMILGTAAYMSPEQAKGQPVGQARADIWAFGCVLYEMLTGRRAFDGEDVSDALRGSHQAEPDWTRSSARLPPSRCFVPQAVFEEGSETASRPYSGHAVGTGRGV